MAVYQGRAWINIASALAISGAVAQWVGVYTLYGVGPMLIVAGSEVAAIGLMGVIRRA